MMSIENIEMYFNGTSNNDDKNAAIGLSFFHTVLLTLFVVTLVILLSSLAYYLMRKKALNKIKHQLIPLYHFDPGEYDNWEDELMGDSTQEKARFCHQYSDGCLFRTELEYFVEDIDSSKSKKKVEIMWSKVG